MWKFDCVADEIKNYSGKMKFRMFDEIGKKNTSPCVEEYFDNMWRQLYREMLC